jgi:hypothetical protein
LSGIIAAGLVCFIICTFFFYFFIGYVRNEKKSI